MAIEWLSRHMEQTCGLRVAVTVDPQAEPQSEEIRILLFEAARELLFNVVKHAETPNAQIDLATSGDRDVSLTVSDQGAGFRLLDSSDEQSNHSGFGLFSIRERLELLGGHLDIEAAPGHGTRVTIQAPSHSLSSPDANLLYTPPSADRAKVSRSSSSISS
jgi:signal transduction histidine kinase